MKKLLVKIFLIYPGLIALIIPMCIEGYMLSEKQKNQTGYYPEYEDLKGEILRQYAEKLVKMSLIIWFLIILLYTFA